MSYFNANGSPATTSTAGTVKVGANLSVDVNGLLSGIPSISTIAVQGDGLFTATSTSTSLTFVPGGRMVLNISTNSNLITITDNAKGHKKHRTKHRNGTYEADIDAAQPEDTITFEEGLGILLSASTATNTVTVAAEFTATSVLQGKLTINPASVSKNAVATQTFTITGLTISHKIVITPASAMTYGIFISAAWVSASNTVSIQFMNISGGNIDLGNIDINYIAWI